jgi:single-strand DNA-binding protein
MMNRIVLMGRLTRDPEMKVIEENGKVVTKFTLAVERAYKSSGGEKTADFIPVVLWGKKAEVAAEYLIKGSLVTVSGRLQTRSYEDKDGNRKFAFDVIADEFQFAEGRKVDENVI